MTKRLECPSVKICIREYGLSCTGLDLKSITTLYYFANEVNYIEGGDGCTVGGFMLSMNHFGGLFNLSNERQIN